MLMGDLIFNLQITERCLHKKHKAFRREKNVTQFKAISNDENVT